jgi:RecA-family ATPase
VRELAFMKNQYGPPARSLILRYQRGLFLPETKEMSLVQIAADSKADAAFLDALDRFTAQGRNVGASLSSPNYAPTLFAREKVGFTKKQLEGAMSRLFNAQKIRVEDYGRSSNRPNLAPANPCPAPRPAQ